MAKSKSKKITGDGSGEALTPIEENVGPQTAPVKTSGGTVQLTRNEGGHQFGETMPRSRAEALGLLDATRPFPGLKSR